MHLRVRGVNAKNRQSSMGEVLGNLAAATADVGDSSTLKDGTDRRYQGCSQSWGDREFVGNRLWR